MPSATTSRCLNHLRQKLLVTNWVHDATGNGITDGASDETFPRAASIEGDLNPTQLPKIRPDGTPVRRRLDVTQIVAQRPTRSVTGKL